MKSLFLLCEYGISPSIVVKLKKNNITTSNFIEMFDKIDMINGITLEKKDEIKKAYFKLEENNKEYSVYDLIEYGLSNSIVDKLYNLGINVDEINYKRCIENGINNSSCLKIKKSLHMFLKNNGIKRKLNSNNIYNFIKNKYNHDYFTIDQIKNDLEENLFCTENISNILLSADFIINENDLFFLNYDITDLEKYGLKDAIITELQEKNITLSDINDNLSKNYNISKFKVNKIKESYKAFEKNEIKFKPDLTIISLFDYLVIFFGQNKFSYEDIILKLKNEKVNFKKCEHYLNKLVLENKIIFLEVEKKYYIKFPRIIEIIENISNDKFHRDIVLKKLNGQTLEQIGNDYNLTRERIRQIFTKELDKINNVYEDKYAKIYKKYYFDLNLFCELFDETAITYYYLKEKYKSENNDVYELINDSSLNDSQIEIIRKKYNLINYNGEDILVDRTAILIAYLKGKEKQVDFEELKNNYNSIILEYNLQLEELQDSDARNIDSILGRSDYILNSFGKNYRYYNCKNLEVEELEELKDLFNIEPGVYSTELFFNDNQMLMKKMDIRDEYELHNLLRKTLGNFDDGIKYYRMPDVHINYEDKFDFIDEKIHELAPINLDEFCEYIYNNYGHKTNTMKAYIVSNFNKYINIKNYDSYLICDCPVFNSEQEEFMKNYMTKDIYSIITIKELLTNEFDVNNFKLINNLNFEKLGYKVRGNYLMKKDISSLENYLRDKILQSDYYIIDPEMKKIGSTFTSYLYKFIYEKLIFKFEENKYITITELNRMGITEYDIEDFLQKIESIIPDNKYFNLYTLNTDFDSKLFSFDFPQCFFETLIMIISNVKMFRLKNNVLFIKTNDTATREKFINSFITKNKIYIYEIKDMIQNKYNIFLQESYIKEFINTNKFYLQSGTNCVYLNKEMYENEVNKWDILKYID